MTTNFELKNSQKLINNRNYYTTQIRRTSVRNFNVQIDTFTATSRTPSENCNDCVNAQNKYAHEASKTSSPTNKEIEDEDRNV